MLRRVAAACLRVVEGAASPWSSSPWQKLDEREVVDLDEERKGAMVSNLLVVICNKRATQRVVNTGSLYQ